MTIKSKDWKNGILMYAGGPLNSDDFLSLAVKNKGIEFAFSKESGDLISFFLFYEV